MCVRMRIFLLVHATPGTKTVLRMCLSMIPHDQQATCTVHISSMCKRYCQCFPQLAQSAARTPAKSDAKRDMFPANFVLQPVNENVKNVPWIGLLGLQCSDC